MLRLIVYAELAIVKDGRANEGCVRISTLFDTRITPLRLDYVGMPFTPRVARAVYPQAPFVTAGHGVDGQAGCPGASGEQRYHWIANG